MIAMKSASAAETGNDGHLPARDQSTLDDIFLREAYSLLSSYDCGIRKGDSKLLIRPATARLILSKLRISKPIIRRILENLERKGLVVRGNQFVAIKRGETNETIS